MPATLEHFGTNYSAEVKTVKTGFDMLGFSHGPGSEV